MNLKLAKAAIASYNNSLDEKDRARLAFFQKFWEAQAEAQSQLADTYEVPAEKELTAAYKSGTPLLTEAPVAIDAEVLAQTLKALADISVAEGLFSDKTVQALNRTHWERVVKASHPELAGTRPTLWLEGFADVLVDDGMDEESASLAALLGIMAVKAQLEKPAQKIMTALKQAKAGQTHPMHCPVCGAEAGMAHVGGRTSSSGRGRLLVCPQCGTAWEFERVRCARCGTQNQSHLHFYNLEGDDAHRIATCDECGGYIRTLYSEDELRPVCYEVEDVVMAKLDAVAQDPRLAAGNVSESTEHK